MLSPKRTKYRKPHRGRLKGQAMRGNKISFGDFALQALEPGGSLHVKSKLAAVP